MSRALATRWRLGSNRPIVGYYQETGGNVFVGHLVRQGQ